MTTQPDPSRLGASDVPASDVGPTLGQPPDPLRDPMLQQIHAVAFAVAFGSMGNDYGNGPEVGDTAMNIANSAVRQYRPLHTQAVQL